MRSKSIAVFVSLVAVTSVAAQDELPIFSGQLVSQFDDLSMPTDVAVSSDGRVYVVDSARNSIKIFDAAGNPLGSLGSVSLGEGQFSGPVGIDVASNGDVYVADKNNKRLQVFKPDGSFRRSLPVAEAGAAAEPVDVAVSAKGKTLYVTTNDTHKVLAMTSRGKPKSAWGGQGEEPAQFNYPATVAVDSADNVYVVDVLNARVQVFTEEGAPTAQYGSYGAKPGMFVRPKGVAVDAAGRIYVSDSYLGVVQVLGSDGVFIGVLAVDGEPARFKAPVGLAFAGGRLYVTDMLAGKVLAFKMEAAL
jgi:tripartite motif-containing protein 71